MPNIPMDDETRKKMIEEMLKAMKLTWEDVFDCQNFFAFMSAETVRKEVNAFVIRETTYKYFLFNGIVFSAHHGYSEESGWVLNPETRKFELKR